MYIYICIYIYVCIYIYIYIYSTCILSSCNHFRELPRYNNNNGFLFVTLH